MLFRALKSKPFARASNLATAHMPVKLGRTDANAAFARALDRQLRVLGLGHVTGVAVRRNRKDEAEGIDIHLALVTLHPRALRTIGSLLEELDAPVGSSVEFLDTGARHLFGRTEGLGLYLDRRDGLADDEDTLDILELCTEALDGDAIYQGSDDLGDQAVLYFYGDNFNRMKNALTFVMTSHPQLKNAYARRLT